MPLLAPESGIIDIIAQESSILQIGQTIATLKLDDESQVKKAKVFEDKFPKMSDPEKTSVRVDKKLLNAKFRVECMLDGYIAGTDIDKEYVPQKVDLNYTSLNAFQHTMDVILQQAS